MNNIELVYATGEQKRLGWILDMRYLDNLRSHFAIDHLDLEEIEAILLIANGESHLIKFEQEGEYDDRT